MLRGFGKRCTTITYLTSYCTGLDILAGAKKWRIWCILKKNVLNLRLNGFNLRLFIIISSEWFDLNNLLVKWTKIFWLSFLRNSLVGWIPVFWLLLIPVFGDYFESPQRQYCIWLGWEWCDTWSILFGKSLFRLIIFTLKY